MIPIFNFRGYTADDPLDKASAMMRFVLSSAITAILTILLIYLITNVWRIIDYRSIWVMVMEVLVFSIILAPLIVMLRKSSSLVLYAIALFPLYLYDLYLEASVRAIGDIALWTYYSGSFVSTIQPPALLFLIALTVDALLVGPVSLWLARVAAHLIYRNSQIQESRPTQKQRQALFPDEWTNETVSKPKRDFGYWILRLLGIGYFSYLLILVIGTLGTAAWPPQIADLMEMTYKNPALAMNTFGKVGIMILLAFTGAYNITLRWHTTLAMAIGHVISTVGSLGFYFYNAPDADYRDFLLTSAIVDGVMVILFIYILLCYKNESNNFSRVKEFPAFFSVPAWLSRTFFYIIAAVSWAEVLLALGMRLFGNPARGLGAVYGYPDPILTNTITAYGTIGLIAFLIATREKLRDYLIGIMLFPMVAGSIACALWFIFSENVLINTRIGTQVAVDQYFMIYFIGSIKVIVLVLALRKMYYNVEYLITTLNPSSARNAMAVYEAIHNGDLQDRSAALQRIDRFAGDVRGRKRGLLNFPFWVVEQILSILFGLHPPFSTMSKEEGRYFLRKYLLRRPQERMRSFIPVFADIVYLLGVSIHAFSTLAHYSNRKKTHAIGYIPPDARDRLQADYPTTAPPLKQTAPLPIDQPDAVNDKPDVPKPPQPLAAKRLSTNLTEPEIPSETDYLIIGSGAGGAVMAYRLAASNIADPEKIMVVERGERYSPLQDMNDNEMEMIAKYYKEGGLQQTKALDMIILQGECVGGTTVVNNAVCFEMGKHARQQWQDIYDIDLSGIDAAYELVGKELEIGPLDERAINENVRDRFLAGVNQYNNSVTENEKLTIENPLKVNARNTIGDGLWNLGNKRLRKRSMLETYIPWAEARGVKIVSNTSAVRFLSDNNKKANAVLLRSATGDLKTVKVNKAVIVAGGCIASSHFLMRSGVRSNVGQNFGCNYAFPLAFGYEEEIRAFDGTQITIGAVDPAERAIFETYFNPPAAFALSIPFFFERNQSVMERYSHYLNFGALVGSDDSGVIEEKADPINGRAFTWRLTERDRERIRYALTTLVKAGQYSGASHAVLPMRPGVSFELTETNIQKFITAINDYPLGMNDLLINSAHPQGGNRMTGDQSSHKNTRVLDSHFRPEGYSNVFVADASLFPTSIGVNPQWTIMAMSSLAVNQVLEV